MIPPNLKDLVTFVPNKDEPIHDWFYYKEGYSKELVEWLIKEYKLSGPIYDPFAGVGTTLLVAKSLGMKSIGTDVSPLTSFICNVKTRSYDTNILKAELDEIAKLKPENVGKYPNKKIRELFRAENLDDIYYYHQKIFEIKDEKVKDLFMLALIDTTGRVANVIKTGGSLKKVKKHHMDVKKLFLGKIKRMILDIERMENKRKQLMENKNKQQNEIREKHNTTQNIGQTFEANKIPEPIEPIIYNEDARTLKLEENSIGCVITSPPYLNKIEYTSVYKMELGLFFDEQETRLRSYVGDIPTVEAGEYAGLPDIAIAYFQDMKKVLENIYFCLKLKGKAFIIVA
ncbi:MAG TPA: DNA methyltransferase, partial [archaeon]|nr:DNA methyltransferase [archaeon]